MNRTPSLLYTAVVIFCLFSLPTMPFMAAAAPVPVLASIAPQKYLIERIGGDAFSVTALVKPQSDPHAYEPSPSELKTAQNAAVWFTLSVPFEDVWLDKITKVAPQLKTISMLKGITRLPAQTVTENAAAVAPTEKNEHGHTSEKEDPHVWLSPMLVREMLPGIARELGKLLPEKAAEFRANAQKLSSELEALDGELAALFSAVPVEKRVFLTFHPSWRYFAFNYQLTELSIEVDGKEPGAKTLDAIVGTAKKHGISTVFIEPQFSKSAAGRIAEVLQGTVVEADPLQENLPELYTSFAQKLMASFPKPVQ